MTKAQLEKYRELLLGMRARLQGEVSHLADEALRTTGGEASGSLSNTPIHMADLGSDNYDQEFTLGLLENGEQRLEEIGAALQRIDQGGFGLCEGDQCGKPIPKPRLDALPFTRYCVECARKMQQSA
jgi:RNA polymerase-binding transcription factor DksA